MTGAERSCKFRAAHRAPEDMLRWVSSNWKCGNV